MEIFARLYKTPQKTWLLSFVFLMMLVHPVFAQEYTPPPMFDIPDPLPPANSVQEDAPRAAPTSQPPVKAVPVNPVPQNRPKPVVEAPKNNIKKGSQSTVKKEVIDVPIPRIKPQAPVVAETVTEAEEPVSPPAPSDAPKKIPGVVTGPKTMPAVPAQDFEAETVYQDEDGDIEGVILQRHTQALEPEIAEETPAPVADVQTLGNLNIYSSDDGLAQKITVPLAQGQMEITTKMLTAIQAKSVEIFDENPDWRLQILSFATAFDQGQSSDRRMSLNRALSVRDALLQLDIEPRQIDVRALGDKTGNPMKDRIDLIYYAPNSSPDAAMQ